MLSHKYLAENLARIGAMLRYECGPWDLPLSRTRALPGADFAGFPNDIGCLTWVVCPPLVPAEFDKKLMGQHTSVLSQK